MTEATSFRAMHRAACGTTAAVLRAAGRQMDLDHIEEEIDVVLHKQRQRAKSEGHEQRDVTAVNVAAHRLENLIHDRRISLASQQGGQASG